jgi:predicted porin
MDGAQDDGDKAMNVKQVCGAVALCGVWVGAASAQTSSVTLYGSIDQYLNYMKSSSGASIKSLQDGAIMRSRLGFRGVEDLGDGLQAKFTLETGLSADTGASAETSRFFDRQAWVGLSSNDLGEFRLGRQNTAVFTRGGNVDFTARTLGSIVNNFGVPARLDNDIAYISPKFAGFQVEAHYAMAESTLGTGSQAVYQFAVDYTAGDFKANYAGVRAKAPKGAAVSKTIGYDNLNANYDYGSGKVYAAFVRSNNVSTTSATAFGNLLGGTGTLVSGASTTAADAARYYNIWQISGDYRVSPSLRVGALYGKIVDTSDSQRGAKGGAIGAYYDLSKRTSVYAMLESMQNEANAGFRAFGSAALSPNFTGTDVYGRRISGTQMGVLHKF